MSDAKTVFIDNVKQWVAIDSQIKLMNERVKKARDMKHAILDKITTYVSENNIENTKIEITDGDLRFYEKREYQPITFKYVEESLGKLIPDKKQVDIILSYLKENREIKITKDIRRNYRSASFS